MTNNDGAIYTYYNVYKINKNKKIPENENKRQKTFIEIYLSKSFNM